MEHQCKTRGGRIVAIGIIPRKPTPLSKAKEFLNRKKKDDLKKSLQNNYKNNKYQRR